MFCALVVTALLLASGELLRRWLRVRRYWAERGVPHLPPHPLFGSLQFLYRKNPGLWIKDLYENFQSPYVGIWLSWRPALVVCDPHIAKNVLVRDHEVFRNRHMGSGASDPIGKHNLLTADDPVWSFYRKRLSPVFTSAKLKATEGLVDTKVSELVQRIQYENDRNNNVDLRSMYSDFSTDIVGTTSFGVVSNALLEGTSLMKRVTGEWMSFNLYRAMSWAAIFFYPDIVDLLRLKFFPESSMQCLRTVFRKMVESRGGYENNKGESKDLIDTLIKIKQTESHDENVTEDLLLAQAAILLEGGFATTSGNLTYITYEMAYNPTLQEKLYQELVGSKESFGNFDAAVLSEMPYLNAVIKETLRKYPPMGWLDRIAAKDYQIDESLTVKAGTPVYVNSIAMHYNPEHFPNPKKFDPDRFLPENSGDIKPFTYLPFGEGPRNCIGKRMALLMIRKAVASVFTHYEVRPLPNSPTPSHFPFARRGLLLMPGVPLSVQFVPRVR